MTEHIDSRVYPFDYYGPEDPQYLKCDSCENEYHITDMEAVTRENYLTAYYCPACWEIAKGSSEQ
jgi:hypothetical protein